MVREKTNPREGVYSAVCPLGRSHAMSARRPASILDLSGKTICGSGHTGFGDEAVSAVAELLKKQYPGIKFVPNTDLPDEASTKEEMATFQEILRQKKCDVVLSGLGC